MANKTCAACDCELDGNAIKVTAIDPVSMREVSMVGSPKISSKELGKLAVRKLKYVMERDGGQ